LNKNPPLPQKMKIFLHRHWKWKSSSTTTTGAAVSPSSTANTVAYSNICGGHFGYFYSHYVWEQLSINTPSFLPRFLSREIFFSAHRTEPTSGFRSSDVSVFINYFFMWLINTLFSNFIMHVSEDGCYVLQEIWSITPHLPPLHLFVGSCRQGRPNMFLGLKRNLNRGILSVLRENKTKLIKKSISSLNRK
jgi:hypothetical protein